MQNQQLPPEPPPIPIELLGEKPKENIAQQEVVTTNQKKINPWVAVGFSLNIIAWIVGTSNGAIHNYNMIWGAVFLCVIGGVMSIVGKNYTIAVICFIDAYYLYDYINSLIEINNIFRGY